MSCWVVVVELEDGGSALRRIGVASDSGSLVVGVKGGVGERVTTRIEASVVC